jgi:N-acetylmuramoyl-L-alanine amidase-like protein
VVPFQLVMVPLSKALGLSLVVERVVELGKNVLEPFVSEQHTRSLPDPNQAAAAVANLQQLADRDRTATAVEQAAEQRLASRAQLSARLDTLRTQLLTEPDASKRAALLTEIGQLKDQLAADEQAGEWQEQVPVGTVLVQPASDPDDGWTLRTLVLQLLGLAVGILLARFGDVRLFATFLPGDHTMPGWLDYVLTGVFVGGGSGPAHVLIQFISERKLTVPTAVVAAAEPAAAKAAAATSSVPTTLGGSGGSDADWRDVPYEGGVDRGVLESVHRRDQDPNLVVYHHTALSSDSTFEDVVGVIKSRTDASGQHWLTGYNCVILADGSIHAFCRWDRYGSHAVGYNRRSLGIAFNGNFETNPTVPFSNPDGRYGESRPTDVQLRAGARVVALWTFLYPIQLDFAGSIIPHKQIASKACPGSNFPYDQFKQLVTFYRQRWEQTSSVMAAIAAFRLKPYLYVRVAS